MKRFGSFELRNVNVLVTSQQAKKPMSRKLSVVDSKLVKPYPAMPPPLPEISHASLHSSIGFSVPANVVSPPPFSFPIAPALPPPLASASAPNSFYLPPCNPADNIAPAPVVGVVQRLWCEAKPSVPAETLQEAIDYACEEVGADFEEIMLHGSCFYPDTIVAHAFNSYRQKTNRKGRT